MEAIRKWQRRALHVADNVCHSSRIPLLILVDIFAMDKNLINNRWKSSHTYIKEACMPHSDYRQYGRETTLLSQPVSESPNLYLKSKASYPSSIVTMVRDSCWGMNPNVFNLYLSILFVMCLAAYMLSPIFHQTRTKEEDSLPAKSEISAPFPRTYVSALRSFGEVEDYIMELDESKGKNEESRKVLQVVQTLKGTLTKLGEEETRRVKNANEMIALLHQCLQKVNAVLEQNIKT